MLIGIVGRIGSGKSTVANYLITEYNFQEYSFAQPLKEIGEIFGFEKEELYGTQAQKLVKNKFWGVSGREFLQKVGTELFRKTLPILLPDIRDGSIWINLFEKKYPQLIQGIDGVGTSLVISDVRFLDEAKAIKNKGGILIKLERKTGSSDKLDKILSHSSEADIDNIFCDYIIDNNGKLEDTFKEIRKIISEENL